MPDRAAFEQKGREQRGPREPRRWGNNRGYKVTSAGRVELNTKELFESPAVKRVADLARQIVELSQKKEAAER